MSRVRMGSVIAATAAAAVLAGCGSSGKPLSTSAQGDTSTGGTTTTAATTSTSSTTPASTVNYHPKIVPSQFTNQVTNRFFPLVPGSTLRYNGIRDGAPTEHRFTVTNQTKTVMGVKTAVIQDVVTSNGSLVEKTTDWYAQDAAGNVWYFGEDTAEYENGVVISTSGTWEAGVDGAQPGIVMPANPKVGDKYRQEFRPGVAEDRASILSVNATAKVPAGTYHNLIMTFDKNPLDPSKKERKWYAAGIGFVKANLHGGGHSETTELVK